MKKWIEINIEENYIIYKDKPQEKIKIKNGSAKIDLQKQKLIIKFEEAGKP